MGHKSPRQFKIISAPPQVIFGKASSSGNFGDGSKSAKSHYMVYGTFRTVPEGLEARVNYIRTYLILLIRHLESILDKVKLRLYFT